jgi:hypothetical protein
VRSKSDFWLNLHRLADDLKKEGSTEDEQIDALMAVLDGLPPATRGVYLEELTRLSHALNDLMLRCKTR